MADQVNPLLVEALTGEVVGDQIPALSMLGSENVKKVAKRKSQIKSLFPENEQTIKCLSCGKNGSYNIGMIFIEPEKYGGTGSSEPKTDEFQVTGYFRCKYCNDAGQWETSHSIQMTIMASLLYFAVSKNLEGRPVQFGYARLFDGSRHKWSTDSEEYLLKKISNGEGNAALIWNKLGNTYYRGGRPELAVAAFEKSLSIDQKLIESHYSLAEILYQVGEKEQALHHYRSLLIYSHEYDQVDPVLLRDFITNSLQNIWRMKEDINTFLAFLPKANEILEREDELSHVVEMEIYQEDRESLYPLAEMYMGKNAKLLPKDKRTLINGQVVEEKTYFSKKKKKKRKRR